MHHARARFTRWLAVFVTCSLFAGGSIAVHAQAVQALTDQLPVEGHYSSAPFDDAGAFVYLDSNVNPSAGEPLERIQAMEFETGTGLSTRLTSLPDGVVPGSVAVSDDGAWLVFLSTSDPLGLNADRSAELFVMQPDGSQLDQLTDFAGDGTIYRLAFAGSGNRVAFVSDADPLATNAAHTPQIFVIGRDGTGLAQITSHTIEDGFPFLEITISDDGQRIAYSHSGDPAGSNSEGNFEIFAINHDGTGLRQLTSTANDDAVAPFLSGNGAKIVFEQSQDVMVIDWDGTGLLTLSGGDYSITPSITDDASVVVFLASEFPLHLVAEVYSINSDGTGETRVTTLNGEKYDSVVSGDGSRILFRTQGPLPGGLNEDGGQALMTVDSSGGDLQLLVELEYHWNQESDITPDGTRIVFTANPYDAATNPWRQQQVFTVEADGSDPTQVTEIESDGVYHLGGITDDGGTIAFSSWGDPLGCNGSGVRKVFTIDADGSNLAQQSPCPASSTSDYPVIGADGSFVVFQSTEDLANGNSDGSAELFRVKISGSGPPVRQLTSDDNSLIKRPRVDGNGVWVVYHSDTTVGNPYGGVQIFRAGTDGSGAEILTDDTAWGASWPDISGSGERIVYSSSADPLGTNPEHNDEIFLLEPSTATLTQLTVTPSGRSYHASISNDGAWVYFKSSAPFFEPTPDSRFEPYRIEVATGTVERVGGLRDGGALGGSGAYTFDHSIRPDGDGDRAVFTAYGDRSGTNPDRSSEVFLVDFNVPTTIEVGKETPTVVSWTVEPQPVRYDVICGDVASLQPGGGNTVDLGAVYCVENDSVDNKTVGDEDPDEPASGQAFFYLHRGSQGVNDGPGSWGHGTGSKDRVAGSGVCDP